MFALPSRATRPVLAAAVALGLAGSAAVGLVATAAPAAAWPTSTVTITGHGYGHGRGMGQWGAFGYATDYGWSYGQILSHYYGGTTVGVRNYGALTVDLSGLDGSGSLTVTSGSGFTAGGVPVAAGGAARLTYQSASSYQLVTSAGCGHTWSAPRTVTTGGVRSSVAAPTSLASMLTICNGDGSRRTYRGALSLVSGAGTTRVVNTVAMEDYLRGVVPRESPASWGDSAGGKGIAALQAQAVAARSYASVQHRYSWASICDSQNCQVYGGAGLNGAGIEDSRTDRAVADTAGRVLVNSGGAIVSAEYSSSTGGWTAGGTFPAVVDLGDTASPFHDWTQTVDASAVGAAFGVGSLQSVSENRNGLGADGGRVLTAVVRGSAGTVTVSGSQFEGALGLRSDWFTVQNPPAPPSLLLSNSLAATPPVDIAQLFGLPGDQPLTCDWNGDGTATGGVYRASTATFYLRDSTAPGAPLHAVLLGRPGDRAVCGDWNGDGTDTIGVYRPSTATFYLVDTNNRTPATPLIAVHLGGSNALPVAGDWDGDHRATPAVFDPSTSTFYLINSLAPGAPRLKYQFGTPGDLPVAGDWDGNGRDSYGVFQYGNHFALANTLGGPPTNELNFGQPGDLPVAGDFNHDGRSTIGVGRGYTVF